MTRKLLQAACAVAFCGILSEAGAAVIVSLDGQKPESEKTLATLNPDNLAGGSTTGTFSWRRNNAKSSDNWDVAISFQAGSSGTLDELGLYLSNGQSGGGHNYDIVIRENNAAPSGSNGNLTGTTLLSTSGTIDLTGQTGDILKFTFSESDVVNLQAGKWYTVTLIWPSTQAIDSSMNFTLFNASTGIDAAGNTVANGGWRRNPGGTWTHDTGRNYLFYAATTIPEPSTYAMLSLAAAAVAVRLRRK